jgi:hypothetical protein
VVAVKNPCEIVSRNILPACRSLIARELIEKHHFTQTLAAEKLGTLEPPRQLSVTTYPPSAARNT